MVANPDTSLTFNDLILRVAEAAGLAYYPEQTNNSAQVPVDPHDLDLCKRSVNDGLEHFYRAHPHWTFLQPEVQITMSPTAQSPLNINGEAHRYRLPWYVSGASTGSIIWSNGTGNYGGEITLTSLERVAAAQAMNPVLTGFPQLACIVAAPRNVAVTVGDRQGWELRVWPKPNAAYVLTARFRIFPRRLLDADERHVAGSMHDQSIVSQAIWCLKRRDAELNPEVIAVYKEEAQQALAESIRLDGVNAPRRLGRASDPSIIEDGFPRLARPLPTGYWNGTSNYNGIAVNTP